MPRTEDPNIRVPIFPIVAIYPGASPTDIEDLVVEPIEDAINELEDIKRLETAIFEGYCLIVVEAEFGVDRDDKFDEVRAAVNQVRPDLPPELASLDVDKFSPQDVIIAQYGLVSESRKYAELQEFGENLEDVIKGIKGIRTVDVLAYPEQEIRVSLDFPKMSNLGIPLKQVIGILQGNNVNLPGGNIQMGDKSFAIKTSGSFKNLDEIKNSVVNANGQNVVYLRDIAKVEFAYEDDRYIGRHNGEKAVFVAVTQKAGFNIIQINEEMGKAVAEFEKTLPDDIRLEKPFIQAPAVESRINDFFGNLLQGVLLVGAVILLFLGFRSSIVVMTVIPTSVIIAIGALDMSGFGLQQISIASLVIALGLLVDNGIVVIENINRFLKEGYSLREAAYKGTGEVGYAIISSTVTTVLAFFPLTQLGGPTGEFLKTLPLTVIFALVASLLLALTLNPLMGSKLLSIKAANKPNFINRGLQWFIEKVYRGTLNFSLKYPLLIILLAVGTLAGSFALFPIVGVSFFPKADKNVLLIDIKTPDGTTLDRTDEATLWVEKTLQKYDLVESYTSNVGRGNPQIYYNRRPRSNNPTYAQVFARLKYFKADEFYPLLDSLRADFRTYAGAKIEVSELSQGPPAEAPIEMKIIGKNIDTLKRIAADMEAVYNKTQGTINVNNPLSLSKTDLQVDINRDKAGMIGVQLSDIDLTVRAGLTGIDVAEVNLADGNQYDLVVRMPFDDHPTVDDFNKIYVANQIGGQVPLRQVANLEFTPTPTRIDHFNTQRAVTVTADIIEGFNVTEVSLDIIDKLNAIPKPNGYTYYIGGELENQQESFGSLGQVLLVALIGIFAVLVLQFRSFSQPFVIFSAIPLAFTGSIFALFLTGYSFSFFAFVGFTSLVGIVINNSIILVDYMNQLRQEGLSLLDAIKKSAETRFTPIILTTTTTIVGLLPLTLTNSGLWSPLGWTIIGGMISSTFLTLLIVPIMLRWFSGKKS
jgi:multidrug efflux pump subunit AcrB